MVKGIMFFLAVWAVVATGIVVFRQMTLREKFDVFKLALWSGGTAVVALVLVVGMVVIF